MFWLGLRFNEYKNENRKCGKEWEGNKSCFKVHFLKKTNKMHRKKEKDFVCGLWFNALLHSINKIKKENNEIPIKTILR